jgi:hypothetical protein
MHAQQKICARCGSNFTCQANNIEACQCSTVVLNAAQLHYLKQHWANCVCQPCLIQISQLNLPQQP